MSRIEKALEKANKLRESTKRFFQADNATVADYKTGLSAFEISEHILDKALVDKHLVCITDPFSPAAEQYKKLRARIMKATENGFLNSIMITSSEMKEGKSITAINLAATMANVVDYTVLLVDADLRNPSIHTYLGIEPRYGLSDYLAGKVDLSDVIIRPGIGKLAVLPGGAPPQNPSELLSSDKMRNLVQELKLRYKDRYVIFDSSPILLTADSLSLGNFVDGIIFVIQATHTSEKTASKALSLIKGTNILGIVFNSVPDFLVNNLYPYYYHYAGAKTSKNSRGNDEPAQK